MGRSDAVKKCSEKPVQIEAIGPLRNEYLVAAQKRNRGSDTGNTREVVQLLFQIEPEALLCASTDGHHDVTNSSLPDPFHQGRILYDSPIHWCQVDAIRGHGDTLRRKPCRIFCAHGGHAKWAVSGKVNIAVPAFISIEFLPSLDHDPTVTF